MSYKCGPLRCSEPCGGAPPEESSSENVDLETAVGFVDRAHAYASTALQQSSAELQKSKDALASVHRSIFPNQPLPADVNALAAPFEGEATTLADYTRAQTVRGSEFTFRLLLGHEVAGDFEAVASDFPRNPDGKTKSLNSVKARASQLAVKLIDTFERKLARTASDSSWRLTLQP